MISFYLFPWIYEGKWNIICLKKNKIESKH